jgi:hypothetical protein
MIAPCQSQGQPGATCHPPPAFCHRCGTITQSVAINLRSGLTGNCCAICRVCRRLRPYLGRWDVSAQNHNTGLTGIGVMDHENSPFYS